MRQRRPTFLRSILPLPHDTHLHPGLIHSSLSLVKAMRAHFYRGLSDTEDDGGGLQREFYFKMLDQLHRVCGISIRLQ